MTSSDRRPFRLPSPEDWNSLVLELGLNARQAHELDIVLRHAEADLAAVAEAAATPAEKRELVAALEALSKALGDVERVIQSRLPELSDALPIDTTSAIGDMLTAREIESVLGVGRVRLDLTTLLWSSVTTLGEISADDVDGATASQRQALGITAGPELLGHFIRRLHLPLQEWLDDHRANRGGRPSNYVRDHLIHVLAKNAHRICDTQPSSNGPFIRLCDAVFRSLGLSTVGLRDAVERALGVRER